MRVKARASDYAGRFAVPWWRAWLIDWETWRAYVAWSVYGFGILTGVLLCGLLLAGCTKSNFTEYTRALVESQRAFCIQAAGGPYQGYIAGGSPETSVTVSASGCVIEGVKK